MILLGWFEPKSELSVPRGIVELDLDPSAERFCLLDRRSMSPIMLAIRPSSGIAKIIVPFEYSIDNHLLALIMDDAGVPSYNVAGADKIQAEIVDAKSVNLF